MFNQVIATTLVAGTLFSLAQPAAQARAIQQCNPETRKCEFVGQSDETELHRGSGRGVALTPINQEPSPTIDRQGVEMAFSAPPGNPCEPEPGQPGQCTSGGSRV